MRRMKDEAKAIRIRCFLYFILQPPPLSFASMPIMTGLSGNEMYLPEPQGHHARRTGDRQQRLLDGLSRLARARRAAGSSAGRSRRSPTIIHEGRLAGVSTAWSHEAEQRGGIGITGVTNELPHLPRQHRISLRRLHACIAQAADAGVTRKFTTSANGQELYCQLDAGFTPIQFVFGNVAYSIGAGGGIIGSLKSHGARRDQGVLRRLQPHPPSRAASASSPKPAPPAPTAVVGIETRTMRFQGVHEMLMLGTASHHPALEVAADRRPAARSPINPPPRRTRTPPIPRSRSAAI